MVLPGGYEFKADMVPSIPPIADVADKGQDAVSQVPDRVEPVNYVNGQGARCQSSYAGFQCVLPADHKGRHKDRPNVSAIGWDEDLSVDHPHHYQGDGMESIDVIEAFNLDFCLGNTVKYVLRAGKKDNEIQDLRKAIWYLNRRIQQLEKA